MAATVAGLSIVMGLAYVALATLALSEVWWFRGERGLSRFGLALAAMGFTCGGHHLVHGEHVLRSGEADTAVLVALLMAAVPAVSVVFLRGEVLLDGRGDRFIRGTPRWLAILPVAFGFAAGWMVTTVLSDVRTTSNVGLALAVALTCCYLLIGYFFLVTQMRRRRLVEGWSLSGLSLGLVFPTCALTHLMLGLTAPVDGHLVTIGALSVPAALWFLWAVLVIFNAEASDWHLTGAVRESEPDRRSPWSARDKWSHPDEHPHVDHHHRPEHISLR